MPTVAACLTMCWHEKSCKRAWAGAAVASIGEFYSKSDSGRCGVLRMGTNMTNKAETGQQAVGSEEG